MYILCNIIKLKKKKKRKTTSSMLHKPFNAGVCYVSVSQILFFILTQTKGKKRILI